MNNITDEEIEQAANKEYSECGDFISDAMNNAYKRGAKWAISKLSGGIRGWVKASERMPRAKAHVKWRWVVTLVEVDYPFVRELFKGDNDHKTKFEWLDESKNDNI